ncbi:uncharacterized protein LOC124734075 [Schistocerca piceifrons]|uniref:uncharacterized protein LOC124734075 n=1 Tax=Schistocerca piceifrons TaxID=274613 RepID=UPI001F5F4A3D|nr:uncharacterized protein LOC124734075 [Schistocerca piceifrons]
MSDMILKDNEILHYLFSLPDDPEDSEAEADYLEDDNTSDAESSRSGMPHEVSGNRTAGGSSDISQITNNTDSRIANVFPDIFADENSYEKAEHNACVINTEETGDQDMEEPVRRLYCSWHTDRAWRKNICIKIKSKERQVETYKLVRSLMQERDVITFEHVFPLALERLVSDPVTAVFGFYLQEHYAKSTRCWAYSYRANSGINTNMHIERMHRIVKYIYLPGKHVKRLDKLIHALMSFVRDKLQDRLIILTKGKLTSKLQDIRSKHGLSFEVVQERIVEEGKGWLVPSTSELGVTYFVQQNVQDWSCKLICIDCQACIHQQSSSSVNVSNFRDVNDDEDILHIYEEGESVASEKESILVELSRGNIESSDLTQEKEKMKSKLAEVIDTISSPGQLEVFKRQLSSLKATLAAVDSNKDNSGIGPCTTSSRREQNIQPQRRLFSTKQRRKVHHFEKPSTAEAQDITVSLLQDSQ